jgi:hypothetical protein
MEDKIERVAEDEASSLPRMCEIRFDCLVKMYDMVVSKPSTLLPFSLRKEIPRKPQWFKSTSTISLEAIKNEDEYLLGRRLKEQFQQLELHIKQYEHN